MICHDTRIRQAKPAEAEALKSTSQTPDAQQRTWILIAILTIATVWAFLNGLRETAGAWDSPEYSHGYLIPLFAIALLAMRREPFAEQVPPAHRWIGIGILAGAMIVRIVAAYTVTMTVDRLMFLPCLAAVFVIAGGLRTLRWAGPPIAFLVFMYPLPRALMDGLLRPLQSLATGCSVYALQTLGVEAYRDGNIIKLEKMDMGVVDACSGLRMATIFLALATAIAMISTTRPWWERLVIFLSAVPIALAVNVIRITLMGLLFNFGIKDEIAKMITHDGAGLLMMPMAIGLMYLECQVLMRLIVEDDDLERRRIVGPTPHGVG